jgi:hypothetical protein
MLRCARQSLQRVDDGVSPRVVDAAVGKRFGDVRAVHGRDACKIGDGAGDTEHAVIATRGEPHTFSGIGKKLLACAVGFRDAVEELAFGFGVGAQARLLEAGALDLARFGHAHGDLARAFGRWR